MSMKQILQILQIVVSAVLIFAIIIQARGTGLGRSFSASQASFSRRGLEKLIYRGTFVIIALFILISILQALV